MHGSASQRIASHQCARLFGLILTLALCRDVDQRALSLSTLVLNELTALAMFFSALSTHAAR
jgi:hypothetical protein